MRPKAYVTSYKLDIHVGNLISKFTTRAHEFYFLNWCQSTGLHAYSDDDSKTEIEESDLEYVEGVTMYDTYLHESFFQYRMGQNKFNAIPCNRTLTDYQYNNFEQAIIMDYRYRLYVDGLPSAVIVRDPETGKVHKDY